MDQNRLYVAMEPAMFQQLGEYCNALGFNANAPLLSLLITRAARGGVLLTDLCIGDGGGPRKVVLKLTNEQAEFLGKATVVLSCSKAAVAFALLRREMDEKWLEGVVG